MTLEGMNVSQIGDTVYIPMQTYEGCVAAEP